MHLRITICHCVKTNNIRRKRTLRGIQGPHKRPNHKVLDLQNLLLELSISSLSYPRVVVHNPLYLFLTIFNSIEKSLKNPKNYEKGESQGDLGHGLRLKVARGLGLALVLVLLVFVCDMCVSGGNGQLLE